jgi:hypothetical protein
LAGLCIEAIEEKEVLTTDLAKRMHDEPGPLAIWRFGGQAVAVQLRTWRTLREAGLFVGSPRRRSPRETARDDRFQSLLSLKS